MIPNLQIIASNLEECLVSRDLVHVYQVTTYRGLGVEQYPDQVFMFILPRIWYGMSEVFFKGLH